MYFSETEWSKSLWISKTIYLLIIAFSSLLVCHHLWESSGTWLVNIFDISIMFYFTYHVLKTSYKKPYLYKALTEEMQIDTKIWQGLPIDSQKSEKYAQIIADSLKASKIYLKPTLIVQDVSDITGISPENINNTITQVYKSNFFDFINKMRIERAVKTLNNDIHNEQNMEMITYQSGFLSKESFYVAFKKNMGKTPSQYIEEIRKKNSR